MAITLPKGFAREYLGRDWFNQIYFGMLSQSQESEGYKPILNKFILRHESTQNNPLPENILLTFYYPENNQQITLSGIAIVGGQPEINHAYEITKKVIPYIESLYIERHDFANNLIKDIISSMLKNVSNPVSIKPLHQVLQTTTGKKDDKLNTFFPILNDDESVITELALPENFRVDAVFRFNITREFFTSHSIGGGLESVSFFRRQNNGRSVKVDLALPLIIRWQPVYNDILIALKERKEVLSENYKGWIIPSIVVFQQPKNNDFTALISNITETQDGSLYYNVALAQSGYKSGKPLSHIQAALQREKFGESEWMDRLNKNLETMKKSPGTANSSSDTILLNLKLELDKVELTSNGLFDFGLVKAQMEDE